MSRMMVSGDHVCVRWGSGSIGDFHYSFEDVFGSGVKVVVVSGCICWGAGGCSLMITSDHYYMRHTDS